jgi:hypothetical protein
MSSLETPSGSSAEHFEFDTIVNSLAITNSELRCLALGALSLNRFVPGEDAYNQIMLEANGQSAPAKIDLMDFNSMVEKTLKEGVETDRDDSGKRIFKKTLPGEGYNILGGHRLNLSVISNIPTIALLGEHTVPRRLGNNGESIDSFEARLVVLEALHTLSSSRWRRTGDLYDRVGENGVSKRVALSHLDQLEEFRLVEHRARPNPKGGRIFEHRVVQSGYFRPPELIEKALTIIRRFAIFDRDFIEEGLDHSERILKSKEHVPGLVQRAIYNDSHFRNTAKKPKQSIDFDT